jgi:hypothetical protein
MCDDKICNILEEYEGEVLSNSESKAELDSRDSGSSHVDDILLGEVTASEIDIEGENEYNEDFLWEHVGNYVV